MFAIYLSMFFLIAGDGTDEVVHLPLVEPLCVKGQEYTHVAVCGRTVKYLTTANAGNCEERMKDVICCDMFHEW